MAGVVSMLLLGGAGTAQAGGHGTHRSLTVADLRAMQQGIAGTVSPAIVYGDIENQNAPDKCIGISVGLAGDWYCTSNPDQTWYWEYGKYDSNGLLWANLVNGDGQCLAVAGGSTDAGAAIWGYTCVRSLDQYWLVDSPYNWAPLVNQKGFESGTGNDVVGVAGGSTDNGARLVLWWFVDGAANQLWETDAG